MESFFGGGKKKNAIRMRSEVFETAKLEILVSTFFGDFKSKKSSIGPW